MRLGDLLVSAGYLTPENLAAALVAQRKHGGRLGDILSQMGFCSEDAVARTLAKQLNVPFVDLGRVHAPDRSVVSRVPLQLALQLNVVPCLYREKDGVLVVAVTNPRDKDIVKRLEAHTRLKIHLAVAGPQAISRARGRFYGNAEELMLEQDDPEVRLQDVQGRTLERRVDDVNREHAERAAQRAAASAAVQGALHAAGAPLAPVAVPSAPHPYTHPSAPPAYAAPPAPSYAAPAYAPVAGVPLKGVPLGPPPSMAPAPTILRGEALPPDQQIAGFTDQKGRTAIKSVADIIRESRTRSPAPPATPGTVTPGPAAARPRPGPPAPPAEASRAAEEPDHRAPPAAEDDDGAFAPEGSSYPAPSGEEPAGAAPREQGPAAGKGTRKAPSSKATASPPPPAVRAPPATLPEANRDSVEVTDSSVVSATEARAAVVESGPTREELLATVVALQNEIVALKAVAVVLFRKGYLTQQEYLEQMARSTHRDA